MAAAIRGCPSTNMGLSSVIQIVGHRLAPRVGGAQSVIKPVGRCSVGTAILRYRFGIINVKPVLVHIEFIQELRAIENRTSTRDRPGRERTNHPRGVGLGVYQGTERKRCRESPARFRRVAPLHNHASGNGAFEDGATDQSEHCARSRSWTRVKAHFAG